MTAARHSPWLTRFAWATALATLGLIGLGGMVTSKEAGMAVPDWPTSYGYNMFALPFSYWVGGIFFEHSHRLFAAFVGLLTSILAAWIWGRETRGRARWGGWIAILILVAMLGHRGSDSADGGAANVPAHFKLLAVVMPILLTVGVAQAVRSRGSLRWLALTAFFAVILQGLLGGFRVALYAQQIGIFHAALAQAFFVLICLIALRTTRWWSRLTEQSNQAASSGSRTTFAALTALIFVQLIIGATMRHQHAGLAVPDFPLAYGRVWPAADEASLAQINAHRTDPLYPEPITANQIHLHMAHRIGALAIFALGAFVAWQTIKRAGRRNFISNLCLFWFGMLLLQATLGAVTVWSNKAADIATLHVTLGAACLALGSTVTIVAFRVCPASSRQDAAAREMTPAPSGARATAA